MTAVSPTPWQRLPADLPAAMRPGLPATVATVAGAVAEATPAYADPAGGKLARDLRTAVEVALAHFLDLAGTGRPALPPRVREVFVGLGAAEAREDRGPETLLAGYRTAARLLLRSAAEALSARRRVDPGELIDLADAVTAYVDQLAAASTDGFARQVRAQAGAEDRRRHLAEVLLRGGAPASVVRTAAAEAGWPPPAAVVPVLVPPDQARELRFRYAVDGLVTERTDDAVLLLPAGPRTGRDRVVEELADRRAVVGPALDWEQLPTAVGLAESARVLIGTAAAPTFVEDHLAVLALRGEPAALAVLSHRRLAPLSGLRPAQRDTLLLTLHSWLRHWGARAEVSAELHVHPQTVSYRLRRLRELLGEGLDDPAVRFELQLVLAAGK